MSTDRHRHGVGGGGGGERDWLCRHIKAIFIALPR